MSDNDDLDLQQWAADWQSVPATVESAERIRHYVKGKTNLFWSFAVIDVGIGGLALPVLLYLGIATTSLVQRVAMLSLASMVVVALVFGWWNRRGVLRASAATIADHIAISVERLRRMRIAWRAGWIVLATEVLFFSIWIWDRLYSGRRDVSEGEERFAWTWLTVFTLAAIISLVKFGRWLTRDAARFEALRRELTANNE